MWFQSLSSLGFALALPVIVGMYLLKRTYIDTPVASNLLWRKALREQEANRPWQRLRRQLLLWLQLAAAALLVLALMGPLVKGQAAAGREVVVVLDTSASMTGMNGNDSLFDQARASLREWLEERGGQTRVTLITTGEDPKVETSGSPKTVIEALAGIRPNFGQADIAAAVTLADATLRGDPDLEIVFVTDDRTGVFEAARVKVSKPLQALTVPAVSANTAIAAFGVRGNTETGRSAVVTLINEGEQAVSGMLTIEAVGIGGGSKPLEDQQSTANSLQSRKVEQSTGYTWQSSEQQSAVDLTLSREQQSISYRLQPDEQRTFRADLPDEAVYYRAAIVSGSGDRYAADDTAYAVGEAAIGEQRRALLVGSGNLFMDKALRLAGVQTVWANAQTFEPDEDTLQSIDWVLLDGDVREADVRSEAWRRLLAAKPVWRIWSAGAGHDDTGGAGENADNGGAIGVGANAGDLDSIGAGTNTGNDGAIGPDASGRQDDGQVAQAGRDRSSAGEYVVPESGDVSVTEHPVVRYLTFREVHFAKLAKTGAEAALGDPIVKVGGVPAIYAGVEKGKPGIVFAFDIKDTDLPLRPEFPILIAQAADWMSGGIAGHLGQAVAGSFLDIQHQTDSASSAWIPVEVLAGYGDLKSAIQGAIDENGMPAGEQAVPGVPGLYRYVEYDGNGNASAGRLLTVTADPLEGRISQKAGAENGAGAADNQTNAGETPEIANGKDDGKTTNSRLEAERLPLTPWIAALLLLFIAAEWEVYRRGFAR